ncbi:glycosyltransferase [Asanoa sp. WMMD1127]|uniref:glycosyltransferase n=1 Tax=Asanoa sp. WMMD1127 TaxID=3016107 RepID=UPI0024169768|nr:glycosyltransferase [Asanoa sp. WMMD1127]MDG4820817.1 glycosyltransferase [Asanoa sp. WMMD1127]
MKAFVLAFGTRGDVQPFVALGRALVDAGHEVLVAGPACYAPLAAALTVPYAPLDDRWNRLTDEPHIQEALATNYRGLKAKRTAVEVVRRTRQYIAAALDDITAAVPAQTDVVVHHTLLPGQHLAEALGVPSVPVALQPNWVPTGAFPCPMWTPAWLPRSFNRLSYRPAALVPQMLLGAVGKHWRARLGLRSRRGSGDPFRRPDGGPASVLQAFSRHVLPEPADWPGYAPVTGYWTLADEDRGPSAALAGFVDSGPPPVYVGFGSMRGLNPESIGEMVQQMVDATGLRAVVAAGSGGIAMNGANTDSVHVVDEAPHDWLFPRTAAVIHHGGAGTTAAALLAGRPQVICPFTGDQPFWSQRMHAIGVATEPVPQRRITAERLVDAVEATRSDTTMPRRAAEVGELVRSEGGTQRAVELLLEICAARSSRSAVE